MSSVDGKLIRDYTNTVHNSLISLISRRASRTNNHLDADTLLKTSLWFTINTTAYIESHNLTSFSIFNLQYVHYNVGLSTQQPEMYPLITNVEQFFLCD